MSRYLSGSTSNSQEADTALAEMEVNVARMFGGDVGDVVADHAGTLLAGNQTQGARRMLEAMNVTEPRQE